MPVGRFISRFSMGDVWALCFGDYWLLAQDLVPQDEALVNQFLAATTSWYNSAVDKEDISKSAFVAACLRKEVRQVGMDPACNLLLRFEDGSELAIPTSTAGVDWQWGVNATGTSPYSNYLVACFWAGEIEASS